MIQIIPSALQMTPTQKLISEIPASVLNVASTLTLANGRTLFTQGVRPAAMYCVLKGEIRLVRTSAAGNEIVLQRTHSGFVAEASIDQPAYHCDAHVTKPSSVLAIPRVAFRAALENERFRNAWIAYISAELRRARSQSERLMLRTARERILHFIETEGRNGSIKLAAAKKAWAAELGLTHEALYRTVKAMLVAGEIEEGLPGSISLKSGKTMPR